MVDFIRVNILENRQVYKSKDIKDMVFTTGGNECILTDRLKRLLKRHFEKQIAFWLPKKRKFEELVFATDLETGEVIEALTAFYGDVVEASCSCWKDLSKK